jgi:hypothetical protein
MSILLEASSNFVRNIEYLAPGPLRCSLVLPRKCRVFLNWGTAASYRIVHNSLFSGHSTIRSHKFWAISYVCPILMQTGVLQYILLTHISASSCASCKTGILRDRQHNSWLQTYIKMLNNHVILFSFHYMFRSSTIISQVVFMNTFRYWIIKINNFFHLSITL